MLKNKIGKRKIKATWACCQEGHVVGVSTNGSTIFTKTSPVEWVSLFMTHCRTNLLLLTSPVLSETSVCDWWTMTYRRLHSCHSFYTKWKESRIMNHQHVYCDLYYAYFTSTYFSVYLPPSIQLAALYASPSISGDSANQFLRDVGLRFSLAKAFSKRWCWWTLPFSGPLYTDWFVHSYCFYCCWYISILCGSQTPLAWIKTKEETLKKQFTPPNELRAFPSEYSSSIIL